MLISPAEPPAIRNAFPDAELSLRTEELGVDFLYATRVGLVGVQRKEYMDLIASATGDRLYRELLLMKRLDLGIFLIEGRPQWTSDGHLLSKYASQFTYRQYAGLLMSVQLQGFRMFWTGSHQESIQFLSALPQWVEKENHTSLLGRPKPQTSWGVRTDRDWGIHWWQSHDGIGPLTAANLYDALGVPVEWTCTEKDLAKVKGVGKVRAAKLWKFLS
jgi:ERCC4-type nuclease